MKTVILNFAKGKWYPMGQLRLSRSLDDVGYTGGRMFIRDEQEVGAPRHDDSPYAFKPALFNAAKAEGYDLAIWMDAAIFAIRDVRPMFEHLEQHGHMFFVNGHVGPWSSDAALKSFGVDREDAMRMIELTGCCLGIDFRNARSLEWLRRWTEKSLDGVTFPGHWTNDNAEVSTDPRVNGHRHDQTAASIIAHQMGMPLVVGHEIQHPGGEGLFQYYENPQRTAWMYGCDNDLSMIRSGVCVCNQGM